MSHASLIVAIQGIDDLDDIDAIEAAVQHQMQPFDENGEWFADGSRWDWWQIGGRYSGKLMGNDVCRRSDLSDTEIADFKEKRARNSWAEYQEFLRDNPAEIASFMYGFKPEDTLESYIAEARAELISAYAFLKDRRWCENERLSWFASKGATECEIKAAGQGIEYKGRCIHTDKELGAQIVNWSEDGSQWGRMFWPRFIRNLAPDTILVGVDYHV